MTMSSMSTERPATTAATQGSRTGGQLLIDALRIHGTDRVFCVPGESYLGALDAFHDKKEIELVVCRHEGAAANMAEADGKLTGKPGICFVTRGPGATHASIGVHTAFQDSTPMILLVGQVTRQHMEREAFQEIDYRRMFGPMAKWVAEIDNAARIPEFLARAFRVATSGRPGPVVLALCEDMLREEVVTEDTLPYQPSQAAPAPADMDEFRRLLAAAERPLVILGGSGWTQQAWTDMQRFAEANALPVTCAFRFQHLFDNSHPNYAGLLGFGLSPKLAERVKSSDLIIAIGPRLGEATTGSYTLLVPPNLPMKFVHVHAGAEELGRVYQPTLGINSGMANFVEALTKMAPIEQPRWREWTQAARADYEAFVTLPKGNEAPISTSQVMAHVRERLAPDSIVCNGAGNFAIWVHRFHAYRRFRSQLAPTSGAMGYGLPAAVAAKARHRDRQVVCFAGDGDFMMYPQELITAVMYKLPIVVIVINNSMYGTIRMHQEAKYPGRVSGTQLMNPDFAAFARSFGMHGERAHSADEFAAQFDRALTAELPTLIEVRVDPAQITPDKRIAVASSNKA
jgi:acetolactate synthase-1/2/3 large subunit